MGAQPASLIWRLYDLLPISLVGGLTLLWCASPSVPVLVRGMGLLSPPDVRRGFYARSPGQVQDVLVGVGQTVQAGQALLTIDQIGQSAPAAGAAGPGGTGPGGTAPEGAGPGGQPQTINARLDALRQQLRGIAEQNRALDEQSQALALRRRQIETTNRPVKSQLSALESLRQDGVIATYSPLWVGAQDLWLRNKADIASIDAGLAQLRAQRAALRAQAAELRANRTGLESERRALVVNAPIGGRLLDLSVQHGQPVVPGQRLGSIRLASRHPGRQAVVLFTAADASRLAVGDPVHLNPQLLSRDSFGSAEQRYGLVPGRIVSLSAASVAVEDVAVEVGSLEEAANLMASARQRSFGEGGDLASQLPGRTGAPLVLAVVKLEAAPTPSGLAWTRSRGPAQPLPQRTPSEVVAEVEHRSVLSYLAPFWRWISGARA